LRPIFFGVFHFKIFRPNTGMGICGRRSAPRVLLKGTCSVGSPAWSIAGLENTTGGSAESARHRIGPGLAVHLGSRKLRTGRVPGIELSATTELVSGRQTFRWPFCQHRGPCRPRLLFASGRCVRITSGRSGLGSASARLGTLPNKRLQLTIASVTPCAGAQAAPATLAAEAIVGQLAEIQRIRV
jgi:hypothetical protein